MTAATTPRPVAIVGPTASGKSDLALELARRLGGEILSVDSMQVYRGMDIGTAKATPAERATVAHHLIDLVEPHEPFTVVDFQHAHDAARADLASRSVTPILAGGTALYLRAVIDRLTPPPRYPEVAAELEGVDTGELHRRLTELDPLGATRMEPTNRRRIVRALEVTLGSGRPFSAHGPGLDTYPDVDEVIVGIDIDRPTLGRRIEQRYDAQMAAGFLDEVARLRAAPGGLSHTAAQALGYKELAAHLDGGLTLDDALDLAVRRTRRFARRQQAWFRRDPRIRWVTFDPNIAAMADRALGDSLQAPDQRGVTCS